MDDPIRSAAKTFAEVMLAQVKAFRKRITGRHNTAVLGAYVEELVRDYVNSWIAPLAIYHGSLWYPKMGETKPMQIDGLIWAPHCGPPIIRQGAFLLLHPQTVRATVEIKASENSIKALHARLRKTWNQFLRGAGHQARDAMAIIVAHPNAKKASRPKWNRVNAQPVELHSFANDNHPIFILFDDTNGKYRPFAPAIENMFRLFWFIARGAF